MIIGIEKNRGKTGITFPFLVILIINPIIFNPHDSNWKKENETSANSLGFVENRRYQIKMNKILFEYFIDSFTNISE